MKILDIKITTLSKKQLLEKISGRISQQKKTVVFTPNPEIIASTLTLKGFKETINKADFNLPDGTGLKIACNLKSIFLRFFHNPLLTTDYQLPTIPTVIHGIDFMLDLCFEAEKNNWTIGLLGGMNGVAEKTKETLLKKFPDLHINYVYGDFKYKPTFFVIPAKAGILNDEKVDIRKNPSAKEQTIPKPTTNIDILFVAMGSPKEQLWILENKEKFQATVFMQVGGSFDILSGRLKRAPRLIQQLGLEWLFRLIQEPKRFTRQLSLIKFLWAVLTTKNSIEK